MTTRIERVCNALAGLSVLSWAVLGTAQELEQGFVSPVRVCTSLLHLCVGLLFIFRAPLRKEGSAAILAVAGLAFLACGISFKAAPPPHAWPLAAEVTFGVGTVIAIVSLLQLGRSFAILPAVRAVVVRGPYRIVRHPAYLGESLLLTSCFLAHVGWLALAISCASLAALVVRIVVEERTLGTAPEYRDYREQVRWRLLPGLW